MKELILELSNYLESGYAVITIVASIAIFIYQSIKLKNERFKQYAIDLYKENNTTAQITSAILLRTYLKPIFHIFKDPYEKDTLNLIVAILRHIPNGPLQKTLADSISYVRKADGQDFQYINLSSASIKPKYRIDFEIYNNTNYLNKRISMRCADFYCSDITSSGVYHINAEKSVFYNCLLCKSSFYNCILEGADFRNADIHNLKFVDCILTDAKFDGAIGLDSAMVVSTATNEKYALINYLNEDGLFDNYCKAIRYQCNDTPKKIFVSRLGEMNTKQKLYFNYILDYLEQKYHYKFEQIDPQEYRESEQISMIKNRMAQCSGIIVFAFSQIHIDSGEIVNKTQQICNEEYSSPWLHIETAMAKALYDFPVMIITEENISCNGIFDNKIISNDNLMFKINYRGVLSDKDESIISHWNRAVEQHKTNA